MIGSDRMNSIFCVFLPGVVGLNVYMLLTKEQDKFKLLINYFIMTLFSNTICLGILKFFKGFDSNLELYIVEHSAFAFKFLILAICLNIIISFIMSVVDKSITCSLEVEEQNEKKNSKKRS